MLNRLFLSLALSARQLHCTARSDSTPLSTFCCGLPHLPCSPSLEPQKTLAHTLTLPADAAGRESVGARPSLPVAAASWRRRKEDGQAAGAAPLPPSPLRLRGRGASTLLCRCCYCCCRYIPPNPHPPR